MWVWESDKDKIEEAQKAYDDFVKQEKIDALEKEMKQWNDYISKVEDSSDIYERELNRQVAKAEWGENWMEQINKDMVDNIDKTVYQAVGKLDELIKKYDELYTKQTEWNNKSQEEIANAEGLFNSDIGSLTTDPNSGLKYDKNINYQALINELEKEKQRQIKENGSYETWIDDQIRNYNALRDAKISGEKMNEQSNVKYTASGSGGSYNIGSAAGKNFIDNAKAGETLKGGDGSTWVKNSDGSTTITTKNGNKYTYEPPKTSTGGSSGGGSSGGSSSKKTISTGTVTKAAGVAAGVIASVVAATTANKKKTASKSYASGGVNDSFGLAALHGEKQRAEVIFNAADAKKLWNYVHSMDNSDFADSIGASARNLFSKLTNNNTNNSTDIHIEHLELPSVKDSQGFVKQLKLISLNR